MTHCCHGSQTTCKWLLQVFVGLVVRDHLMVLLRRALARGTTANLEVTYEDLNHQFVTAAARHLIWEQHMAVLQVNLSAFRLACCKSVNSPATNEE